MGIRKQIRMSIYNAIIIPSLNNDLNKDLQTKKDVILTVNVFVEEPQSIIQLRISRKLLVNAFKGISLFSQRGMNAYLITASGTLDRRPVPVIARSFSEYDLSMLVTSIEANRKPLTIFPARIHKYIRTEAEASTSGTTSRKAPIVFRDPVVRFRVPTCALSATIGTSSFSQFASSSSSSLSAKKRKQNTASSSKVETSFSVPEDSSKGKAKEASICKKHNTKIKHDIQEEREGSIRRSARIKNQKKAY